MKKELKGFICGVLATSVISIGMASANSVWDNISVLKNDINVVVNGENVTADNFLYNDITYLPLRAVSTALGANVEYDEETNTAYIGERKDNVTVIKSKYTPMQEVDNFLICFEDDLYYIQAQHIIDLAKEKGLETNEEKLIGNQSTILTINGGSWTMEVLSNGWRYIPYDTFVDEIEPLLK